MGRLLLTSGQVSVLLSSTIVIFFTTALFLAGYILQQQTVHALQASFKPNEPSHPNAPARDLLSSTIASSPRLGGSLGSKRNAAYQSFLAPASSAPQAADWNRLAHVQVVKDHHGVCNSIMLFASLHELRSPARRILLFPLTWAADLNPTRGSASDPYMMSTRRLLKLAARRYRVELRPMTPLVEGADEDKSASYSLASVYALGDLDRAMVMQTPGLLQDTEPLDQMLAYSAASSLAVVAPSQEAGSKGDEVVVIHPAKDAFAALRASEFANATENLAADVDLLKRVLPDPLVLDPETSKGTAAHLLRSVGALRDVDDAFNATAWLQTTSYVRFSDDMLPRGPEYDVPYDQRIKARPRNKDADWVWTKLYGLFAQKRMDICGLDLEVWREWE